MLTHAGRQSLASDLLAFVTSQLAPSNATGLGTEPSHLQEMPAGASHRSTSPQHHRSPHPIISPCTGTPWTRDQGWVRRISALHGLGPAYLTEPKALGAGPGLTVPLLGPGGLSATRQSWSVQETEPPPGPVTAQGTNCPGNYGSSQPSPPRARCCSQWPSLTEPRAARTFN